MKMQKLYKTWIHLKNEDTFYASNLQKKNGIKTNDLNVPENDKIRKMKTRTVEK